MGCPCSKEHEMREQMRIMLKELNESRRKILELEAQAKSLAAAREQEERQPMNRTTSPSMTPGRSHDDSTRRAYGKQGGSDERSASGERSGEKKKRKSLRETLATAHAGFPALYKAEEDKSQTQKKRTISNSGLGRL
mmetsp:Transcript_79517/g.229955  ORF Transcript_79517/g.229955 Transcript_79517/m.229955 type:complete len:137 (-) Transcript_79517:262-672(-)